MYKRQEELQARVVYEKANIGLAFDGDADRLLAVDELGNVVDGDQIMAIVDVYKRQTHRRGYQDQNRFRL